MENGVRANSILVLLPQKTLSEPYEVVRREAGLAGHGMVAVSTVSGMAQKLVELFWSAISSDVGFQNPFQFPAFLNLETAQYYMAHLVRPLLDEGFFESVTLDRHRLYSQILDNLNKSAMVGFPHVEIGERLKSAWIGEPAQLRVYDDVQTCANMFREFCYQNNLLDWSLQIEIFRKFLWSHPFVKAYLQNSYQHIIFDNIEEDMPVAHDVVLDWLPNLQSALFIFDHDGAFRKFLGADPNSALQLRDACSESVQFMHNYSAPAHLQNLASNLSRYIISQDEGSPILTEEASYLVPDDLELRVDQSVSEPASDYGDPVIFKREKYYPEMLQWVTGQVKKLVYEQNVPPEEIVIVSPYLPDALRFSLRISLEQAGIPVRSHRPSRPLGEEPATQCLLALTKLTFPEMGFVPAPSDIARALFLAIDGLDLVRASLLTEIVFRKRDGKAMLSSFELIKADIQDRITYSVGERYEYLRNWLGERRAEFELNAGDYEGLDYFLSRLFSEVLSQPGFGFHTSLDHGTVTAQLIQSVTNFRLSLQQSIQAREPFLTREYLLMVEDGLLAAQYLPSWRSRHVRGILISPAFSFIMSNTPVDYQVWLDIGSRGWYERLDQPLTHPYVLSRNWQLGKAWTELDEVNAGEAQLISLVRGLIRRCRKTIILGLSKFDDQGYEESGLLLHAFNEALSHRTAND